MATARTTIIPPGSSGYYHCVSRCVRRAFLCGFDKLTAKNFDHRRGWVVERMNELAQIYAVRVLAFSAMSNHPRSSRGQATRCWEYNSLDTFE